MRSVRLTLGWPPAPKKIFVTDVREPLCTRQVAFECAPRAISLSICIDVQHDQRDLAPVRAFLVGIEQAQIRDAVFFIVNGEVGNQRALDRRTMSSSLTNTGKSTNIAADFVAR